MPSGKASKRKRRVPAAPPPTRSKASPGLRQASPRVIATAAVVAAVVVVGIVLAVVLGGGGGGSSNSLKDVPAVGSLKYGVPGASAVNALFKGIPQSGTTLGDPKAPLTLTEFIDPQCPYCQEFETQVFPSIVSQYVRTGKLRVQMEPWAFIGPDSVTGQAAELAAAQQNRAFNYAALLYDNQGTENTGWLDDGMVAEVAESIPGLEVHTLLNNRSSSSVKSAQKQVDDLANTYQVDSTPTLYVGKTGTKGKLVDMPSVTDKAALVAAIEAAG